MICLKIDCPIKVFMLFLSMLLFLWVVQQKYNFGAILYRPFLGVRFLIFLSVSNDKLYVAQKYSCSGIITDKNTSLPLSYVTVQFFKVSDSTIYAGAITNEQGNFLIQNFIQGDYLCRISHAGYQ